MREVVSGTLTNEHMLEELIIGKTSEGFISELIKRILEGSMNSYQIAASLVLLRAKGESGRDLAEAAELVLSKAQTEAPPNYIFGDIVGTGGDGHDTINISTLASLTAASVGMPVAKHGNISVSSKCGSADVLRELGLNLSIDSRKARQNLDELKWCFLFAPTYHPSFKSLSEVRTLLKIKTIFNILGPLVNPFRPQIILMGVYDPRFIKPCAEALKKLGLSKALVVHGSGLDEIALHGPTSGALLADGHISNLYLNPSDLGLGSYNLEEIRGAGPAQNAAEFKNLLSGQGSPAKIAMIAASAGALLWLGGYAPTLKGGVSLAQEALFKAKPIALFKKILEMNDA